MAQFFLAKSDHSLAKANAAYLERRDKMNEAFLQFSLLHDIEANEWYPASTTLKIVPTERDLETFVNQLMKSEYGLFRKKSKTNTLWRLYIEEHKIEPPEKPLLPFIFYSEEGGRSRWNSFLLDNGDYYIMVDSDSEYTAPDGVEVITGSAYYLALEEVEKKNSEEN